MRVLVPAILLVPLLAGCVAGPPWTRPYDSYGSVAVANPMFVSHPDPDYVWESLVDVLDDEFRIEHEEPVRVLGGVITEGRLETYPQPASTLLEPWRRDSASRFDKLEATLQSMRRRLTARVMPAQGGFWIEIAAFLELEDMARPAMATAGAATFRYDGGLTRIVNPVGEQEVSRGWIPQGRDTALEQYLLYHLQTRFAGHGVPRGTQIQESGSGAIMSREKPATNLVAYRAQSPSRIAAAAPETQLAPIPERPSSDRTDTPDFLIPSYHNRSPPLTLTDHESLSFEAGDEAGIEYEAPAFERLGSRLFHVPALQELLTDVSFDYYHFYSGPGLFGIAMTLGAGAVLANTSLDEDFRHWYHEDVRNSDCISWAKTAKKLGDGTIVIPAVCAAALLGPSLNSDGGDVLAEWGGRCVRSYLVGVPIVMGLQYALGASRPEESTAGSHWKPFDDTNSISGHAFIGAVPFLAAAQMTDAWILKLPLYALSTAAAWSRVNDEAHYLSQVLMGWCFAYLATAAVDETEMRRQTFIVTPVMMREGPGIGLIWKM
jgi:membrane-associated phospholipid phosphatase